VYEQVEFVKEALAQQPANGGGAAGHGDVATVVALMPTSFWATFPLMISVFCHSAACRLLETTYFLIEFMTSPNGSSACSGQYAAHWSYRTRPMSRASAMAKQALTAAPISSSKYGSATCRAPRPPRRGK